MSSIADILTKASALPSLFAVHGETVSILSGLDVGKKFTAIQETGQDILIDEPFGSDRRGKRFLRFRDGAAKPRLADGDIIQTADGTRWRAVKAPQDGHQTTDYELSQITAKDQT
jgi:hypothetical protein